MSEPIVIVATFHPAEGKLDELVEALKGAVGAVHGEPGCLLYSIHRGLDGTVALIEKWESRELLDRHTAGTAVEGVRAALAGRLAAPQSLMVLSPEPAGDPTKGAISAISGT